MSYIAFDLDALNKAPSVARAARVSEDAIIGGLLRMWAFCFREKADSLSALQVAGFFESPSDVTPALVAFEFLQSSGASFRVRGAERYLRVSEARSRGGKAASGNLKRGQAAGRQPEVSPGSLPAPAGEQPESSPGSSPALTPSTEHRTPNTKKDDLQPPVAAFEVQPPDVETIDTWSKEDFWKAAEVTRRSMGYPPQKWPSPVALSRWWGESRGVAEVRELAAAFSRFAHDKHWRATAPPAPFAGFMSQWSNFLPARES